MLFAPSFSRFPRLEPLPRESFESPLSRRKERKGGLSCLTARQSDRLHRTVQTVPGRRATVFSVRFRGKIRSPGADGERRVGTACQNAVDFRDHDVRRHRLEAHRETRVARARTTRLVSGTALTTVGVVGILLDVTVSLSVADSRGLRSCANPRRAPAPNDRPK